MVEYWVEKLKIAYENRLSNKELFDLHMEMNRALFPEEVSEVYKRIWEKFCAK